MASFLVGMGSWRFWQRLLTGVGVAYIGTVLTLGGRPEAKVAFRWLAVAWAFFLCLHYRLGEPVLDAGGRLRRRQRQSIRALGQIELAATLLVATLTAAELGLRTWGDPALAAANALDAYRLDRGRDYGRGLRGNALGYPGPDFQTQKPPGVLRIAALGNSFAVGHAVPFADNYLSRLARELPGCEVYNFGVSGAGPRDYCLILEQDVCQFHPDLVLVSLFVGNNITEIMPHPRSLDPQQHAVYVVLNRLWQELREWLRPVPTDPIHVGAGPPPTGLPLEAFRAVEARRLEVCVNPPGGAVEKKWRRTFADLERLIASCRRSHVAVAAVLIPDEFQVNADVLAAAVQDAGLDRAALRLDLPQRRLETFLTQRGVPCLDLLPFFQRSPGMYLPCDTHWNAAGHRLAGRQIACWLSKKEMASATRARRARISRSSSSPRRPVP